MISTPRPSARPHNRGTSHAPCPTGHATEPVGCATGGGPRSLRPTASRSCARPGPLQIQAHLTPRLRTPEQLTHTPLQLWLEQHERVLAVKAPLWALVRGRSRCRPRIGRTSGGLAPPERRGEGRASVRLGAVPPAAGAHWLLVRRKLSKPDAMAYYVV